MDARSTIPATPAVVTGVQWWNRKAVLAALSRPQMPARHVDTLAEAVAQAASVGGHVVAWASRVDVSAETTCRNAGVPLVRIEDGFVRSVGLGAGLASGCSYVLDAAGIYYDATRPSDLERMLETTDVAETDRERGARLAARMRNGRLSKYNVGRSVTERLFPPGREAVLVPGQVANDAGIRRTISATIDCAKSENVNLDLLRAVRERHPAAFVLYKPHPDVAGGLRPGHIEADVAARFADRVVGDCDIVDLIDQCDLVETISSLTGLEALVRGKAVAVHGTPFYAGWGLTDDLTTAERRSRRRSLEELLFVTLVPYCRYVDPVTHRQCEVETVIDRLAELKGRRAHRWLAGVKQQASWLGRKIGL